MALDLSFGSDLDENDVSEEISQTSRLYEDDEEESASLDTMIFNFRASSMKSKAAIEANPPAYSPNSPSSRASSLRMPSPPSRLARNKAKRSMKSPIKGSFNKNERFRQLSPKKANKNQQKLTEEAMTPMPKLTQIPKPKPSLLLPPKRIAVSQPKAVAVRPRSTPSLESSPSPPPPSSSSSSPKSSALSWSPSSITEEIESMDQITGEESIDNLIGQDIRDLNILISHGRRSVTSKEVTAALRQSTRFRRNAEDTEEKSQDNDEDGARTGSDSPFLLFPPQSNRSSVTREHSTPFQLDAPRRRTKKYKVAGEENQPPPLKEEEKATVAEEEDSFSEELKRLRARHRQAKLQAVKSNKDEAKDESASTGDVEAINSSMSSKIREVANAMDEMLLLALQPFERRRKEQAQADEEATSRTTEQIANNQIQNSALPLASQAIVEQLELTFAQMMERRNADLKAEEEAATQAKAADAASKKEDNEKRLAEERAAKQREAEILSLIPLKGKLLTSSSDIEEALVRLEYAEHKAQQAIQRIVDQSTSADKRVEDEIESLRQQTMRRMQGIESQLAGGTVSTADTHIDRDEDTQESEDNSEDNRLPYHELIQRQVVEKLELTMVQLRHVLGIDAKEAAEAEEKRIKEDEAKKKQQLEREQELERQKQQQMDADAARQRVMGVSSLDELHGNWTLEIDKNAATNIGHEAWNYYRNAADCLPPFFDMKGAMEKFNHLTVMMEDIDQQQQHEAAAKQQSDHRYHQVMGASNGAFSVRSNEESIVDGSHASSRHSNHYSPQAHSRRRIYNSPLVSKMSRFKRSQWQRDRLQHVTETIECLQSDRRQKTSWFYSHQQRHSQSPAHQ